jgi:hypothetical protein
MDLLMESTRIIEAQLLTRTLAMRLAIGKKGITISHIHQLDFLAATVDTEVVKSICLYPKKIDHTAVPPPVAYRIAKQAIKYGINSQTLPCPTRAERHAKASPT